jgi:hypothetical protein
MPSRIGLLVYWLVTGKLYGQDQPAKPIKVTVPRPSGHPFAPNVKPQQRDWKTANKLFDHPSGCNCSTCTLTASLGVQVRQQWGQK